MADKDDAQIGDTVIYQGKRCAVIQFNRHGILTLEELPDGTIYEGVNPSEIRLVEYPNPEDN